MFTKIQKYSDQELIQNLNLCALNEKKYLALFIAYLAEVRKRELHFKLGYKSLMEYCQEVLKLDQGQVWVRSQTAGMALDYPLVLELIAQGELTLTSASLIAPVINQDNADEIFERCRGKSKREVEEVLVCYQPKAELKPSIKPAQRDLFSKVGAVSQEIVTSSPVITQQLKKAEIKPVNENRFNFKFSASASLKKKIEQLAQLLNLDPVGDLERVLEFATEVAIKEKTEKQIKEKKGAKPKVIKRKPPQAVKRLVFKRAGYQCEQKGPDGRRCTAKYNLQIDHIRPWALNGDHSLLNLRILCKAHNLYKSRRDFPPPRSGVH